MFDLADRTNTWLLFNAHDHTDEQEGHLMFSKRSRPLIIDSSLLKVLRFTLRKVVVLLAGDKSVRSISERILLAGTIGVTSMEGRGVWVWVMTRG
jgi:hypothetical protein